MQRSSTSLQKSCRLSECLRRPSVSQLSSCRAVISSIKPRLRGVSTAIPYRTRLPILNFLHPPFVRSAAQTQRRLDRQTRRYANGSEDDSTPPSIQGWSQEELERQKGLEYQRESEEAITKIFEELETVSPQNESNRVTDNQESEIVPHLSSRIAARLIDSLRDEMTPSDQLELSNLTPEEQSSLNALRTILRGSIPNRQQQAIEICQRNHLINYLNYTERRAFVRYLYKSEHRNHLLQLLAWFPHSRMVVPTLCRLGRLQDAQQNALADLNSTPNLITIFQVVLVVDEYAKRSDWANVISLWENAVMLPVIEDVRSIINPDRRYFTLLHCLAKIPNPTKWFIAKAESVVLNPTAPTKMVEFIKILGGCLVRGLSLDNQEVTALDVIKYLVTTFKEIDQQTLLWEMHALRKCGRPKGAVELYLAYRNNEFTTLPDRTKNAINPDRLRLMIQNEGMASASLLNNFPILKQIFEDIYALGLQPDVYSYATIMHAFSRHGQAEFVHQLYEGFIQSGRTPNIYIYAELLFVRVMLLDIPGLEETFKMIKDTGLEPGIVLYDMMTSAYGMTLDVHNAMRVFREYIRLGNKPHEQMVSYLILMFSNRNDTTAAVEMFNLLSEFGITPSVRSFNCLLNGYANTKDRINAEAVVAKIREVKLKPNIVTWNILLKLYVHRKELNGVLDVLARMRRDGMEPNGITWATVIQAFANHGGTEAAVNVRRVMNRMLAVGMRLEVSHWNGLLRATLEQSKAKLLSSDSRLEELQKVYDEMLDQGVKPNNSTHLILISAYSKFGRRSGLEVAQGILSRLTSIPDHLDLTSVESPRTALSPNLFAPVFRQQAKTIHTEKIQEVFDSYINSTASVGGLPANPDTEMLTALLDVYRQHNDLEAVAKVWRALKIHVDNVSRSFASSSENTTEFVVPGNRFLLCDAFSHYMRTLADAKQIDLIDILWDQLSQEGYDFNCENWNTRIRLYLANKKHVVWAFRACDEVLMDGWETKQRIVRKKGNTKRIPQWLRERRKRDQSLNLVNRAIWPLETDLMESEPLTVAELEYQKIQKPEYYPYSGTLDAFLKLRKDLLMGMPIVDSSGQERSGPEVWERLKEAFPRIVRAMFLYLKKMPLDARRRMGVFLEKDIPNGRNIEKEREAGKDLVKDVQSSANG